MLWESFWDNMKRNRMIKQNETPLYQSDELNKFLQEHKAGQFTHYNAPKEHLCMIEYNNTLCYAVIENDHDIIYKLIIRPADFKNDIGQGAESYITKEFKKK